ncbi:unnamed protein product, partial [Rotaria sp. Silwood2]
MAKNSTSVEGDNNEKIFYEKVDEYIYSLHKNYRKKCAIKQQVYNDILKCLLLPKGTSSNLYSSKFVYWTKCHFNLVKIAGIDIVFCVKLKKPVCIYETFYTVISEAHIAVSHGGHEKTYFEITSQYPWIPRSCIEIFLKQCIPCQTRKPIKHHIVSKPIISLGGRSRHPQSQGCIERENGVLSDALSKYVCTNNSSSWSDALLPVVYGINTRKSTVTKTIPYEVMFGQPPRSDSDFWKLVQQGGIEDEKDLPTPVGESNDDLVDDTLDNPINFDERIDFEVIDLLNQLSDNVTSCSTIDTSSKLINTPSRSSLAVATTSYKHTNNFNLNDCVGIAIHPVDRTNTDPKYLPCLIIEKTEKNNLFLYKLTCQYGVLENIFEVGQFVNLKDACPDELKQIDVGYLKSITLIEASKLYSRGSTTGHTCNCRGKCANKTCP